VYFVYILKCADTSLYTGITTNVERRLAEHRKGTGGRYTRAKGASAVVYVERHASRSSASKREAEIKKWNRREKLKFIRYMQKNGAYIRRDTPPSRSIF